MKPWLLLPSKAAHDLSPYFSRAYGCFKPFQTLTWNPLTWNHLEFSNRLGICGGVDKNGENIKDWWTLGPGFIEVGTITPEPQKANPGLIMDRNIPQKALWNKMGFPSKGIAFAQSRLKKISKPHFTPLFINIGKNRVTSEDDAHKDYIKCIDGLYEYADAFVVNISSPNTKGLRDLLEPPKLKSFLQPITAHLESLCKKKGINKIPVLLKASPDLEEDSLKNMLQCSLDLNIDGWVLTNTTNQLRDKLPFPKEGGISGKPLSDLSKKTLKTTLEFLGEKRKGKLIISAGGIMSADDAFERLRMGADLVQVYSALVYEGPFFFRNVADHAREAH